MGVFAGVFYCLTAQKTELGCRLSSLLTTYYFFSFLLNSALLTHLLGLIGFLGLLFFFWYFFKNFDLHRKVTATLVFTPPPPSQPNVFTIVCPVKFLMISLLKSQQLNHCSTIDSRGNHGYTKSPPALMGTGLSLLRNAVLIWLLSGKALIFSQRQQLMVTVDANWNLEEKTLGFGFLSYLARQITCGTH